MARTRAPDFEKSLRELEQLVEKLEQGDLPLDDAMKIYERGFALSRECQTALQQAQARVDVLNQRDPADADPQPQPFGADDDEADSLTP
jgi:exodeoxyribonuclease VII small subunit